MAQSTQDKHQEEERLHAEQSLEWQTLTGHLAQGAVLPESKEILSKLRTQFSACERDKLFALTAEMLRVISSHSSYFCFHPVETKPALQSIKFERVLNTQELFEIKLILEMSLKAKAFASGKESLPRRQDFPLLASLISNVDPDAQLFDKLVRSIDPEGHILSSASEALKKARDECAQAERKLVTDLERLLKNSEVKEALQDPVWMRREDRFVLPVRTDRKSSVDGITVGVSQSGSTLFIEPASLAASRSLLDAARRDEQIAIAQILAALSAECHLKEDMLFQCAELLLKLDELMARALLAQKLGATRPVLHSNFTKPRFIMSGARHPLFVLEDKPCVVNDFSLAHKAEHKLELSTGPVTEQSREQPQVVILSGPNAGGKTVTMKTVGLFVLMTQAGLFVPAVYFETFQFDRVYAAIGDKQSREEDLSTFSAHLKTLLGILKHATDHSLVLLDEGFVGTDPSMGAALARAVLESLAQKKICTIITTHFSQLKLLADESSLFLNACMEFEDIQLTPTYRLLQGIPGQSYAFELAERMGFESQILDQARIYHGKEAGRLERLLKELQHERNQAAQEREAQQTLRKELEELKHSMNFEYKKLLKAKDELTENYEIQLTKKLNAFRNGLEIQERQFVKQKERLLRDIEDRRAKLYNEKEAEAPQVSLSMNENQKPNLDKPLPLKDFADLASLADKLSHRNRHLSRGQKGKPSELRRSHHNLRDQSRDFQDAWPKDISPKELLGEIVEEAKKNEALLREEFLDVKQNLCSDIDAYLEQSGSQEKQILLTQSQENMDSRVKELQAKHTQADFEPGRSVRCARFQGLGEVTEKANSKGLVGCQFGIIKAKVHYSELQIMGSTPKTDASNDKKLSTYRSPARRPGHSMFAKKAQGAAVLDVSLPPITVFKSRTIDLRGCESDVALDKLDMFLDQVFREDMSSFTILHGHGTGAVKTAVRDWLKTFQTPCRYRPGTQGEGGDGVTVVVFDC